jgi:hypothetical protein
MLRKCLTSISLANVNEKDPFGLFFVNLLFLNFLLAFIIKKAAYFLGAI